MPDGLVPPTPLHEFDPSFDAVINPSIHPPRLDCPERAVMCWFGDVVRHRTEGITPFHHVPFEHGDHAICVIEHPREQSSRSSAQVLGAPAAVTSLEVVVSLGASKLIGCGGAGMHPPRVRRRARDRPHRGRPRRGHELPLRPGRCGRRTHPRALAAIDDVLNEAGVPHDRGLTWTTDAFFRETAAKVARRREQGCITVEMEASAMFAAAAFRGVVYGQLLYAGDDVSAEEWDHRDWEKQGSARDRLLDLALDAVLRL